MDSIIAGFDTLIPGHHAVAVILVGAVAAMGVSVGFISSLLLSWRQDHRSTRESTTVLMGHLMDQQRAELERLGTEAETLRRQIGQMADDRLQLHRAVGNLRDQVISGRVIIHEYERRLGLPETAFDILPTLVVIPTS